MCSPPSLQGLKTVFVRAFLAELGKGNIELAVLFARAFLVQEENPGVRIIDDPIVLVLAS